MVLNGVKLCFFLSEDFLSNCGIVFPVSVVVYAKLNKLFYFHLLHIIYLYRQVLCHSVYHYVPNHIGDKDFNEGLLRH